MAKEIILPFSELKGTLDAISNEPTLEITENGKYNVKGYDYADVNVEGGGGSSDFSTAEVTIILGGALASATVLVPNTYDSEEFSGLFSDTTIAGNEPRILTCVLYKGNADFSSKYPITDSSGNVEVDGTEATISGDCVITISNSPN